MKPFKPTRKSGKGPEAKIQDAIIKMLRMKQWYVKIMHGNEFTNGFPDLFACHTTYGIRLIEVKNPLKYRFTNAQMRDFPLLSANGARIHILVAATEAEYKKLFGPSNWVTFLSVFKP